MQSKTSKHWQQNSLHSYRSDSDWLLGVGGIYLFIFFVKKLTLVFTFLLVNVFKQVNDSLDVNSETFGELHLNWVTNKIRNKSKTQHFCRLFKPGID